MARHDCGRDLRVEDLGYEFVAASCEACGELILLRRSQARLGLRDVLHAVAAGWCTFSRYQGCMWAPFP